MAWRWLDTRTQTEGLPGKGHLEEPGLLKIKDFLKDVIAQPLIVTGLNS